MTESPQRHESLFVMTIAPTIPTIYGSANKTYNKVQSGSYYLEAYYYDDYYEDWYWEGNTYP